MTDERLLEPSIPDRSARHASIEFVRAGTRRCEKAGVVIWYGESAWWSLPRPSPTPAGDKPPRYIFPVPSGVHRIDMKLPA